MTVKELQKLADTIAKELIQDKRIGVLSYSDKGIFAQLLSKKLKKQR